MLDSDTKRRINTCRDILVGKVPDPKSQVEQITIALIYKFMDDMDLQAEEMGGVRSFFTGEYERYAWAKLVSPGVSGQEMLNTYSEALTKMVENANCLRCSATSSATPIYPIATLKRCAASCVRSTASATIIASGWAMRSHICCRCWAARAMLVNSAPRAMSSISWSRSSIPRRRRSSSIPPAARRVS